jgi:AraC family transcriptional activator of pobA
MKLQKEIPVFSLNSITSRGWNISNYTDPDHVDLTFKAVHRDDYYIFIFQKQGRSRMMLDFNTVEINGCAVLCIMPGQVHQGIFADNVAAWFLATAPEMVKDTFRHFFKEQLPSTQLAEFGAEQSKSLSQIMELLADEHNHSDDQSISEEISRSLRDTCIGMIVREFQKPAETNDPVKSRTVIITRQFKRLLSHAFKTLKNPSGYAEFLNISPLVQPGLFPLLCSIKQITWDYHY